LRPRAGRRLRDGGAGFGHCGSAHCGPRAAGATSGSRTRQGSTGPTSAVERGERGIALDNIWLLADTLGVTPADLIREN
jgi:hypothetical protein